MVDTRQSLMGQAKAFSVAGMRCDEAEELEEAAKSLDRRTDLATELLSGDTWMEQGMELSNSDA